MMIEESAEREASRMNGPAQHLLTPLVKACHRADKARVGQWVVTP